MSGQINPEGHLSQEDVAVPVRKREFTPSNLFLIPVDFDPSPKSTEPAPCSRALELLAHFLLEETQASGAALAFFEGDRLVYRACAGSAASGHIVSLQPLGDWFGGLEPFTHLTGDECDAITSVFEGDLISLQSHAESVIFAPFRSADASGFVEVFSTDPSAFHHRECLIVQLIVAVVADAISSEGEAGICDSAVLAHSAEQTLLKLKGMTEPAQIKLIGKKPLVSSNIRIVKSDSDGNAGAFTPSAPSRAQAPAIAAGKISLHEELAPADPSPVAAEFAPTSAGTGNVKLKLPNRTFTSFGTQSVDASRRKNMGWIATLSVAGLLLCFLLGVEFRNARSHVSATPHIEEPHLGNGGVLVPSHMNLTDDPVARRAAFSNPGSKARLLALARSGDASAQFQLAMLLELGKGVDQSCSQAAAWMAKAADSGYAPAEYNLGLRYWNGDGVWVSHAEAMRWLQRAAQHGHLQAAALMTKLRSAN